MKPKQILVTPVNYFKDGWRWVGFRFTNTKEGWEILGGPNNPKNFPYEKGHEVQNCGFLTGHN